ncbi:uncharacterized protein [Haliotis cracherodii]|uniref:uncharacterized protein isoform X1 n=1 Tax=Haliotis cracherodii TaxID=6455 RepID=UPI0039ED2861
MTISRVLVLLAFTAAAATRHFRKRDWVPPVDVAQCQELEQQTLNNLTVVREIMRGDGLNTLVTDGALNLDCSAATLRGNKDMIDEAWGMCVSSLDLDVPFFTAVYTYICANQQAFVQSEPCLSSGGPVEARRNCHMESRDYEAKCRQEPVCIENSLSNRPECSTDTASLLRGMAGIEYSVFMDDCRYRIY